MQEFSIFIANFNALLLCFFKSNIYRNGLITGYFIGTKPVIGSVSGKGKLIDFVRDVSSDLLYDSLCARVSDRDGKPFPFIAAINDT